MIPLFHDQIANGGPVTITDPDMTRFLLSLDDAVDVIFAALRDARAGETYVPRVPAVRIAELAEALIGERQIETTLTGIRPGEKLHEILVSDEESHRTVERAGYYVIQPILPELRISELDGQPLAGEYISSHAVMAPQEIHALLKKRGLLVESPSEVEGKIPR